jgi:hypothetical protein
VKEVQIRASESVPSQRSIVASEYCARQIGTSEIEVRPFTLKLHAMEVSSSEIHIRRQVVAKTNCSN